MNLLFPAGEITFHKLAADGSILKDWRAPALNMTANVVCKKCNETWMSDIESKHAKPAMSELILGKNVEKISTAQAHSIALFAFKTAVIANHMLPENEEFFDVSHRYAFRESLSIPPRVIMWLVGLEPQLSGGLRNHNVTFPNKNGTALALNVCTYCVGQFGFQVVSAKTDTITEVQSLPTPPGLTVPFYPFLEGGVSWLRRIVLGREAFDGFHARWNSVKFS